MGGIYIPMDLPKRKSMFLILSTNGEVWEIDGYGENEDRYIGTAIPLPNHGRLIDADVLEQEIVRCVKKWTDADGPHYTASSAGSTG